jgi:hypothetical protein
MIKKSLNPWLNTFHLNLTYLLSGLLGGITDGNLFMKLFSKVLHWKVLFEGNF